MQSLQTIQAEQRKAAMREAIENKLPLLFTPDDLLHPYTIEMMARSLPIIEQTPNGFKEVNSYFVDSSGLSDPFELIVHNCLSFDEFLLEIKANHFYAITGEGQFQVHVGEFVREEETEQ